MTTTNTEKTIQKIKETAKEYQTAYVIKTRGTFRAKADLYYVYYVSSKNPQPDDLVVMELYDYQWDNLPAYTKLETVANARIAIKDLLSRGAYRSQMDWNLLVRKLV